MTITAQMVKELRQKTGAGMMDCKKALKENNGDIEAAIQKILVAQEYQEGSTRVKKVELSVLYERLDLIDTRIARISGGCVSLSPVFGDSK